MGTVPPLGEINPDVMDVEDLEVLVQHLDNLTRYCALKGFAMRERARGRLRNAHGFEEQCEQLYARLPNSWRW